MIQQSASTDKISFARRLGYLRWQASSTARSGLITITGGDATVLSNLLLYLLAGASAGFLGGLLGIGGGLLIVAALSLTLSSSGIPASEIIRVSVATSLAGMALTFVSSTIAHYRSGNILIATWLPLAPGLVIGSILGTHLAQFVSGLALRLIITCFCAIAAWRMAFVAPLQAAEAGHVPRSIWLLPSGIGIATISSLVGIGGGSLTVPLLVHLGVKPVRAVGTSAACGLVIALTSAVNDMVTLHPQSHAMPSGMIGYVYVPAAIAASFAAMATAPFGVYVANRVSGVALKRSFALFLFVIGIVIAAG